MAKWMCNVPCGVVSQVGWSADSLCQLQVFSKDPLMGVDIRATPWGNGEDGEQIPSVRVRE